MNKLKVTLETYNGLLQSMPSADTATQWFEIHLLGSKVKYKKMKSLWLYACNGCLDRIIKF